MISFKKYIKKAVHQVVDKWIGLLFIMIIGGGGTAATDYFKNHYYLPDRVTALENTARARDIKDSTFRSKTRIQNRLYRDQHRNDSTTLASYKQLFVQHKWIKP